MNHADTYFWRSIHQTSPFILSHSYFVAQDLSVSYIWYTCAYTKGGKGGKRTQERRNFSVLRFIMKISFS